MRDTSNFSRQMGRIIGFFVGSNILVYILLRWNETGLWFDDLLMGSILICPTLICISATLCLLAGYDSKSSVEKKEL